MGQRTPLRPRPTRTTGMALGAIGLTAFVLTLAISDSVVSADARPILAITAMLLTLVGLMMALADIE